MRLFCAKGSAPPVAVAAREYGHRTGEDVRVETCGAECREGHARVSGEGGAPAAPHGFVHEVLGRGYAMAVAGSESDIDDLEAAGGVIPGSRRGLGLREAAILVPAARSEEIRSFDDLFRPGVRTAISPIDCLRGVCEDVMGRSGRTGEARPRITKRVEGCMALVDTLVRDDGVDAAIGWSSFVYFHRDIRAIPLPEPYRIYRETCAALLEGSDGRPEAEAFLAYLLSEEGRGHFARHGWIFSPTG